MCVCECECLWEHKARRQTIHCMQVSRGRGPRSAIRDLLHPSCIFTLACTFDHCQHACFVRPIKWAARAVSGNKSLVLGASLVTGQAKKPTAIAPEPPKLLLSYPVHDEALCLIVRILWTMCPWRSCKSALKNADATI